MLSIKWEVPMIQHISIQPYQVRGYSEIKINSPEAMNGFPLIAIDADSYIGGAEIQSGINFAPEAGRHCITIGKGCSLADSITFIIDINHDYKSVAQGNMFCLKDMKRTWKTGRKGSIIIQNDVWVGHGATIMAGVTLHNGCVIAADAVVTKDVPPYAIVGGNPAKVIRYRFDSNTIVSLQKIAWWDWPAEVKLARKTDFDLPVKEFIEKYSCHAGSAGRALPATPIEGQKEIVLFVADIAEPFPLYPKVFEQYFEKDRQNTELIIYLSKEASTPKNLKRIDQILQEYSDRDSYVTLQTGTDIDEQLLFQMADYYVATRHSRTVRHTCLADLYDVKILYGTDEPIFPESLQ